MHSRLINYWIFERDTIARGHINLALGTNADLSSLSLKMHSASSTIKEKIHEGAESYFNMKN